MATVDPVANISPPPSLLKLSRLIDIPLNYDLDLSSPKGVANSISLIAEALNRITPLFDIMDLNFSTLYNNDNNLNTTTGTVNSAYAAGPTTLSGETDLVSVTFTTKAVPYAIIGKARLVWTNAVAQINHDATLSLYEDAVLLDSSSGRYDGAPTSSSTRDFVISLPVSAPRTPTAASHTYKITATPTAPTTSWTAENMSLVIIEGV